MAFTDVNIGAAADDGTGDPLRTAFQKINGNFSNAQVQLNAKADSQETQDALASQQAQLDEKASLASFDNLTQRVQENASAINDVRNATTPAALAGDGLIANAGKIDVNPGDGLVLDSGQVKIDPDLLDAIHGAASQQQVSQLSGTVDLQQTAINNLQEQVVTASGLAGPGLQVQDGKLTPLVGAGLEVSTGNLLQISGEFAAEVNGKLNTEDFEGALLEIGNLLAAKVEVSAKASAADIQNGTAGKWVDAAGLKDSRVAFCAVGGVAQTIPFNATTRVTGLTSIIFNLGNGYSGSQFTAPVAGIYDIKGLISVAGVSGTVVTNPWSQILLYKNGVSQGGPYNFSAVRSDGYSSIAANWLVELAVGDVLTLYLHQYILNAGVSIGANANSSFAGHLVR